MRSDEEICEAEWKGGKSVLVEIGCQLRDMSSFVYVVLLFEIFEGFLGVGENFVVVVVGVDGEEEVDCFHGWGDSGAEGSLRVYCWEVGALELNETVHISRFDDFAEGLHVTHVREGGVLVEIEFGVGEGVERSVVLEGVDTS